MHRILYQAANAAVKHKGSIFEIVYRRFVLCPRRGPNVANRTATLYIHYKRADGTWAYAKPVVKANGRMKPLYVLVDSREKHHPEARYKLSWYESCRKRFETWARTATSLSPPSTGAKRR